MANRSAQEKITKITTKTTNTARKPGHKRCGNSGADHFQLSFCSVSVTVTNLLLAVSDFGVRKPPTKARLCRTQAKKLPVHKRASTPSWPSSKESETRYQREREGRRKTRARRGWKEKRRKGKKENEEKLEEKCRMSNKRL